MTLNAEQLDALLRRLGPDRERAGLRYEELRQQLIKIFGNRRCASPEDLADEALDRAGRRLLEMGPEFAGHDAARFVFGVAWTIARESPRRRFAVPLLETWEVPDPKSVVEEHGHQRELCLERCLQTLNDSERHLILAYYEGEKGAKISHRSAMAVEHGLSSNALRIKIHRITRRLRNCVLRCLGDRGPCGSRRHWRPIGPTNLKGH
jgi:DNA-directed RNA polymerase specialized sigma24 family protein